MKRKKRKKVPRNLPNDPTLIKKASTKANLVRGLAALDSLWKRGVTPKDLENHFLLTWFAFENGNVFRLAKTLNLHRNTLVLNYKQKFKKPSTVKLRKYWLGLGVLHAKREFNEKLLEFYHRIIKRPQLLSRENEGLANLWLMGVDRKTVRAHYVLWALRRGIKLTQICRNMRKNKRSVHRFRVYATRPGSPAKKWLEPLKATKAEWYPPGLRGRKGRSGKK